MVANDVGVGVVAFCPVHATILGSGAPSSIQDWQPTHLSIFPGQTVTPGKAEYPAGIGWLWVDITEDKLGGHMGMARFRVRLRDTKRFMEIVTVWAEGETAAINDVKTWFEVQHDLGQVWVEEEAELIGRTPIQETLAKPNRTRG